MANYSSKDLVISIKDNGGSPQTFTGYVRAIGGISIEAILQESTAYGDSWQEFLSTGIRKMAPITIGGFYDTAATSGPDVLFAGHEGDLREDTVFTYGGSKTTTVDTYVQKYERLPKLGAMTEFQVTLQPTGSVAEA